MATWTSVMSQHFKRSDQTMSEFAAELRQLDQADRIWFAEQFRKEGIECPDPPAPTQQ